MVKNKGFSNLRIFRSRTLPNHVHNTDFTALKLLNFHASMPKPAFSVRGFPMLKRFLIFFMALPLATAFAAVDVNQATEAELDGIKGVGPATSRLIVAERSKSQFKSWEDFRGRIKGVGSKTAAKFSAQGMTVGGATYEGDVAEAKPAKK
jgi:competence protein ComEA